MSTEIGQKQSILTGTPLTFTLHITYPICLPENWKMWLISFKDLNILRLAFLFITFNALLKTVDGVKSCVKRTTHDFTASTVILLKLENNVSNLSNKTRWKLSFRQNSKSRSSWHFYFVYLHHKQWIKKFTSFLLKAESKTQNSKSLQGCHVSVYTAWYFCKV